MSDAKSSSEEAGLFSFFLDHDDPALINLADNLTYLVSSEPTPGTENCTKLP